MRQHRLLRDESTMELGSQTLAINTSNTGPRVSARPYRMHPNNNAVCDCNTNTNINLLQEYDGDAMKVKGDLIMKKTNKSTLKINDVCYLLGISEIEVCNLIRAGAFPVMLKKGTVRIPEEPFRDWFEFYHLGGVA